LIDNVYNTANAKDKLPNEVSGWDFTGKDGGDPDGANGGFGKNRTLSLKPSL
jgi:hypothetical protein